MFKFFAGIIVVFLLFLSGSVPYSLLYNEKGLKSLTQEPLVGEKFSCKSDKKVYNPGDIMRFSYSIDLQNMTNRFVIASVYSEIVTSMKVTPNLRTVFLTPNEKYTLKFSVAQKLMPIPMRGPGSSDIKFSCSIDAKVGWQDFS